MFRPKITKHPTKCVFTAVPRETHLLGASMAADLFRQDGRDIAHKGELDHDGILHFVATSSVALIGLSADDNHGLAPLARLVIALRICLPEPFIMVSGAILSTSYDDVKALGIYILPTCMDDTIEQAQDIWIQTVDRAKVG